MIRGVDVFPDGRCRHWYQETDVVCFRFACCQGVWACRACHDDVADHPATPWPRDDPQPAVLCGACGFSYTAKAYLAREAEACLCCSHGWNPKCRDHEADYFEGAA